MVRTWLIIPALGALAACGGGSRPEAPVVAPGAYQARGEDPSWSLAVDGANIVYVDETNRVRVSEPSGGRSVPQEGRLAGRRIVIDTTARSCVLRSGAVYRQTVRVSVDGRTFQGCGGQPSSDLGLNRSNWTILSVNGRATISDRPFIAQFGERRLTMQLGCGTISAPYVASGRTLSAGALTKSAIACADPSFEQNAERALSMPLAMETIGTDQLILRNQLGSIALLRSRP